MIALQRFLMVGLWLLVAPSLGAAQSADDGGLFQVRMNDDGAQRECVAPDELALDGVTMFTPLENMTRRGVPSQRQGFRLKGYIELTRLFYDGLVVDTQFGKVVGMHSASPGYRTPSGLGVGLSRGDVMAILGGEPTPAEPPDYGDRVARTTGPSGADFSIAACEDEVAWGFYLNLYFNDMDRVNEISITQAW